MDADKRLLDIIFGEDSVGETAEDRARSSKRAWVRSQDHMALCIEGITYEGGLLMTSFEVFSTYGLDKLYEALDKNSAIIVCDHSEPASTIIRRRKSLGMSREQLAEATGLSLNDIADAESVDTRTRFAILEKIADKLGLDRLKLSWVPDALKSAE